MKYKGKEHVGTNEEIIPILRPEGDIFLVAKPIGDWDEFDKLVSEPIAPEVVRPGGIRTRNTQDRTYIEALDKYAETRTNYIIIKSLWETPDLEWDIVKLENTSTWERWREEFSNFGVNEFEQMRIMRAVLRVNALDEVMVDEARQRFLLDRSQPKE